MVNILYVVGPVLGYLRAGSFCVAVHTNLTLRVKLPQALLQVREHCVVLHVPDWAQSCEKCSQSKVGSKMTSVKEMR